MLRKSQEFDFEDTPQAATMLDIVVSQQEYHKLSRRLGINSETPVKNDPEQTLQQAVELVAFEIAQRLLQQTTIHPEAEGQYSVLSICLQREAQDSEGTLTFRIIGQQTETMTVNLQFTNNQPVATF
jgi:hypothetical protein